MQTGRSIRFERCVFEHLGAIRLDLDGGCQDCAIEGCVFTDVSAGCLKIGKVSDPSRSDTRARDSRNRASNCCVHHAPGEYRGGIGVFTGYVSDLLHHFVQFLSDGGAIYSLSAQPDSAGHPNYGHDIPWGAGSVAGTRTRGAPAATSITT